MAGLFGGLFDFNHDGNMSTLERMAEFHFLNSMTQKREGSVLDDEYDDEEIREILEAEGLDPEELENMDEEERRVVLEKAGLDPDDFDF